MSLLRLPSRKPPCRASQHGFTLVELLVAIALMAVLSIISWRGLDSITSLRERLAADADHTDRLLAMLGQLERDLALTAPDMVLQAAASPPLPDGTSPPAHALPFGLDIAGSSANPGSPALHIVRADPVSPGTWQRVVWSHDGTSLRRAVGDAASRYPLPDPGTPVEVMPDVTAFGLRAWLPRTGWTALPLDPGATAAITGLEVTVQRAGHGDSAHTYQRIVALP